MAGWAMNSGSLEKDKFPAGRYGDEYDMSGAILFLASRAGANVNGMVLLIDGGSVGVVPATY
jgi:NAD(P)-dependent dehydrogenase (short-subunit alcohol dehydrogenase family)